MLAGLPHFHGRLLHVSNDSNHLGWYFSTMVAEKYFRRIRAVRNAKVT
jgi:hypothetical protein